MTVSGGLGLIPVGGTVVTLPQLAGAFLLVAGTVTSQNLLFQMREVLMFCISGKEMGAPQETGCMTAPGILPRWQVRSSHSMD